MNKDLLCEYFEKYLIDKFVLQLISYELKEVKGSSDISIKLLESSDYITIDGSGVGLADSAFDALLVFALIHFALIGFALRCLVCDVLCHTSGQI